MTIKLLQICAVPSPKSKASQIAKLLPDIEEALAQGHSHRVIFNHIKKCRENST